MTLFCRDF